MATYLLDVNVLLALVWPTHVHHQAVEAWFTKSSPDWATCPVTECGFVRISSNPKFVSATVTPQTALAALKTMTGQTRHYFWQGISLADSPHMPCRAVRGHNQVMDAYLLALALHHGGILATLDKPILTLATTDVERAAVFLVPV